MTTKPKRIIITVLNGLHFVFSLWFVSWFWWQVDSGESLKYWWEFPLGITSAGWVATALIIFMFSLFKTADYP
jgi:hypothetical protein